MKNPNLEILKTLPREILFSFISQGEQYQNSNFPNLKHLSNLDFGHLKLFRVSILEIRICR